MKKLAIGIVVILCLGVVVWQLSNVMTFAEPISVEEATTKVNNLYEGNIVEINEDNQVYQLILQADNGVFEIIMDREAGTITSITKLESKNDAKAPTEGKPEEETTSQGAQEQRPQPSQQETNSQQEDTSEQQQTPAKPAESQPPHSGQQTPTKPAESQPPHSGQQTEQPTQPKPPTQITKEQAVAIALANVSGEVDDIDLEQYGDTLYYLIEIEREEAEDATIQIHAITGEVKSITWDD